MRSMKAAGIGWRPPFLKAEQVDDRPFEIITAEARPSRFNQGQFEIIVQARLLTTFPQYQPLYDADGELIEAFSWSAALSGQRNDIVTHFGRNPNDSLGPVMFQWVQTDNGTANAFVSIEDYVGELPGQRLPARPQQVVAPSRAVAPRGQVARNFPNRPQGAAAVSANGRAMAGPSARSTGPSNVRGQAVPDDVDFADWPDSPDPDR